MDRPAPTAHAHHNLPAPGRALVGRDADVARAGADVQAGLVLGRQVGERRVLAFGLDALGRLGTAEGQYAEAHAAFRESLQLRRDLGDVGRIADTLDSIAALAAAEAPDERAIKLAG